MNWPFSFSKETSKDAKFLKLDQILTDAALLKRQKKEIEELRAKLLVCGDHIALCLRMLDLLLHKI